MELIYILSFLLFLTNIYLLKKNTYTQSAILWLIVYFILTIIINSLIIFLLNKIGISATLLARSVIFIAMSIPCMFITLKKREIQKYNCSIKEMLMVSIILVMTFIIGKYRFTSNMDLYFETTDPAIHYYLAQKFAVTNKLIEHSDLDKIHGGGQGASLFFSYTSLGTCFQIVEKISNNIDIKVNTFIIYELSVIAISAISLFYLIYHFMENKKMHKFILLAILIFLYMMGYPYNNLIFGFHYLGISIMIFLILLNIVQKAFEHKITIYEIVTVALYAITIFSTYYLFVPIVYGTVGLYILYLWKIKKQLSLKEALRYIVFMLGIPFILGMYYYFIRSMFISSSGDTINPFELEGYIYRNLISNFLLLIPVIIYNIILNIKNKKCTLFDFAFILNLIFIVLLFVPLYNGNIASYYFYKLYYILWPISFIILGINTINNNQKTNGFAISILITLFVLYIVNYKNIDNYLYEKNPLMNNTTFVSSIVNIYNFNTIKSNKSLTNQIFTHQEVNDLNEIYQHNKYLQNEELIFQGNLLQKYWLYSLTHINPNAGSSYPSSFYEEIANYEELLQAGEIKYFILKKEEIKENISKKYEVQYKTNSYILLKKIG